MGHHLCYLIIELHVSRYEIAQTVQLKLWVRQARCKARVGKAGRAIASRNETWHGQVRGKSGAGEEGQREGGSKKGVFF